MDREALADNNGGGGAYAGPRGARWPSVRLVVSGGRHMGHVTRHRRSDFRGDHVLRN